MTAERQIRFWLIGFAVFFLALWLLKSVLLPFVLGMAVAYLFDPVCDRLEKIGLSRTFATALVTAGFILLMVALLLLILPAVIGQLINLMQAAPDYFDAVRGLLLAARLGSIHFQGRFLAAAPTPRHDRRAGS